MDIFISYRRQDTAGYALGLRREITHHLPDARVFLDVEAIDAGARWRDVIRDSVQGCDLMLVMIGDEWLQTRDGIKKIEREEDPVRFEISTALTRKDVRVMPVLVEEARMPPVDELPPEVRGLCEYNAHAIHDSSYDQDVNALVERLLKLSAAVDPRTSGTPAAAGPHPPLVSNEGKYPSKITERWLRDHVSGMGREQLLSLVAELFHRGWSGDDVYEYALGYSPLKPPNRLPVRITTLWLTTNVPLLSPKRVAKLANELRSRGWSEHDVRVHVYGNRQPGLAAGIPQRLSDAYVKRFAPLMTAEEQDQLAAALVLRGWSGAEIRMHLPYADIPSAV